MPDAQVRVQVHILLPFFLGHFSSQILHDGARFVIAGDAHNWTELAALHAFSVEWRANSNDHFEILIGAAGHGHARGQTIVGRGTLSAHDILRRHLHGMLHLAHLSHVLVH